MTIQTHIHQVTRIEIRPIVESQWAAPSGWRDIVLHTDKGEAFRLAVYADDIANLKLEIQE